MHRREQGDRGELSAMQYFAGRGAAISIPFGYSPHYDFIADLDGRLLRVQVKTCRLQRDGRRYELRVATSGGNQSWNRIIKRLDPSRFDYLVAVVGDGRRWCIPADRVEGGCAIVLGGPKYAPFEVEGGTALDCRAPRGDSRAVKGEGL